MNALSKLWAFWKSLELDSKLTAASLALMAFAWLLDYVRNPNTAAQLFIPIIVLMMLVFFLLMVAETLKREKRLEGVVTREMQSLRSELPTSIASFINLHGDLEKLGIVSVSNGRDDRHFLDLLKASNKEVAFMAISFYHYVSIMRTELPPLLAEKQLRVRVLLLQPESPFLNEKEREEGIPSRIKGELHGAIGMLREIKRDAQERGYKGEMEVRQYTGLPYCSMYVFDESTILYNPYLRHMPGKSLPVFEVTNAGNDLFRAYLRHFTRVWDDKTTAVVTTSEGIARALPPDVNS